MRKATFYMQQNCQDFSRFLSRKLASQKVVGSYKKKKTAKNNISCKMSFRDRDFPKQHMREFYPSRLVLNAQESTTS